MKTLKTFFLLFAVFFGSLQAQDLYWLETEGGNNDDIPQAVAYDGQGNSYLGINFEGTITVGINTFTSQDETDFVIVKYDNMGTVLGAKKFGGPLQTVIRDIEVRDDGTVVAVGYTQGFNDVDGVGYASNGQEDMFILTMNSNFAVLDVIVAGSSSDDRAYELALDSEGNIYFAGIYRGTFFILGDVFSHTAFSDAFVGKIDLNGNLVWMQTAEGPSYNAAFAIELVNDSILVIGGEFINTISFDGQTITSPSAGSDQSLIIQMDTAGNYLWHYMATDAGFNAVQALASDEDGNIYVAGYLQTFVTTFGNGDTSLSAMGNRDTYLLKLDDDGNFVWVRQEASNGWFFPNVLAGY